jgi:hypothetical protein
VVGLSNGIGSFEFILLGQTVSISRISLLEITKKPAFAGQYWDKRTPEMATEPLFRLETSNCSLFRISRSHFRLWNCLAAMLNHVVNLLLFLSPR